jgi:hypothetical protein
MLKPAAIASAITILLGIALGLQASSLRPVNPSGLARGFRRRGLAMELLQSKQELDLILGPFDWNSRVMLWQQIVDFFFIASYLTTFLTLAWIAAQHSLTWGLAIATLAGAAAVSDIVEDIGIIVVCVCSSSDGAIKTVRKAATMKWACSFLILAALAPLFWRSGTNATRIASGLLGLAGLFGAVVIFSSNGRLIERATGLMSLALLWSSAVLLWAAFASPGYNVL